MNSNTTSAQDHQIREASKVATIDDLLAIISDLDDQLDDWSDKTGYGTPDDAKAELESRAAGIDQLNSELAAAKCRVSELEWDAEGVVNREAVLEAELKEARRQLETAERRIEELETQIVEATT